MKLHRIPVGPFATNCVLVTDDAGDGIVVDPGGDADRIAERISALSIRPALIVLTHGHLDHCLDVAAISNRYGIPVAIHPLDLPLYRNLPRQVEALLGPVAAAAMRPDPLPEPGLLLNDGDRIPIGSLEAEVLHLPGHTPGGVGLLIRTEPPTLLCGDTIFRDGIGRTDLWGGSFESLIHSIRTRIFRLPDDTRLVCGHGAETTVGREKAFFPYD